MNNLILMLDGVQTRAVDVFDRLPRAVLISLFTWRRAEPADDLPGTDRYGWWGDTYAETVGDQIGSRLWLLSRSKITDATPAQAKAYADESLAWMLTDGVAAAVTTEAERQGLDRIALGVTVTRPDRTAMNLRFANVWDALHV